MSCVEETRKDIQRRRSVTLAQNSNLKHRNTNKGKEDSLEDAIKNEHFTASDKRKVLELLLSNENVLLFLYEKLFPRAISQGTLNNPTSVKAGAAQHHNYKKGYHNLGFRPSTVGPKLGRH